ncbi:MAG: Ig-like domain-containing protein, partial [Deltaproteobacteria bacterium]|nr:Ig-like domain-containing protein [Deltaproteobacteria bacterium]
LTVFGTQDVVLPIALPLNPTGAPTALTVVARDRAGNATQSDAAYVLVLPDAPPQVSMQALSTSVETITQAELASGYVRLLQGNLATLWFGATDDVGVVRMQVDYAGQTVLDQALSPDKNFAGTVQFTPPYGADGSPTVLTLTATDTAGHQGQAQLLIETRVAVPPALAIAAPIAGQHLPSGSIQLFFQAVAGDDTAVGSLDFLVEGQVAAHLSAGQPIDVSDTLGEDGLPIALDPSVRAAVASLPPPYNDTSRVRLYTALVPLPPGFLALPPDTPSAPVELRVVATDIEGNTSRVDREIELVPDLEPPSVDIFRPTVNEPAVEGTTALVQVDAYDNVFVDRIEIAAGPTQDQLQVVAVQGGFAPVNAHQGSAFNIYSPLVTVQVPVPLLANLGATDVAAYYVGIRARDVNGNWSPYFVQPITVVRDLAPTVAILSPADGATVVGGQPATVTLLADDDVKVSSVLLFVNGAPLLPLTSPPWVFEVPVPADATTLTLQAVAADSYGHQVHSQLVRVQVGADQPPTVAIATPRSGNVLTEGRDFQLQIAAIDDVAIASVQAKVLGGLQGTLTFAANASPYSFRVPLPYGSAGRTLTLQASATDVAGHTVQASDVVVTVAKDTTPPQVHFLTPADGSEIVAGTHTDVEVEATDDVTVASVAFKVNGQLAVTMPAGPYRFSYQAPSNAAGQTVTFEAIATDTSANTTSKSISIGIIADQPPSATLVAPPKFVVGIPAELDALASDDNAVAYVSFHAGLADPPPEVGRSYLLPYHSSYTAPPELVGQTLIVRARATDNAGQKTFSAPQSVPVVADQPPVISIAKPAVGSVVFDGSRVRIEAEATDAEGPVREVAFLVDGKRVDTATAPAGIPGYPHRFAGTFIAPVGSGNRIFAITAVATDSAHQETVSAPVLIGTIRDTVPPETQLVDPADGQVITEGTNFTLRASGLDNSAVKSVEFFDNEGAGVRSLGQTSVSVPGPSRPLYTVPWLSPVGLAGQHVPFYAQATDTSGNVGTSQTVTVELGLHAPDVLIPLPPVALGDGSLEYHRLTGLSVNADDLGVIGGHTSLTNRLGTFDAAGTTMGALGYVDVDGPPVSTAMADGTVVASVGHWVKSTGVFAGQELQVVDVRNPVLPIVRGTIDLPGPDIGGVALRDRLAFVADGASGVVVIELGDPTAPQRVATVPVVGSARDVAVSGDLLLVAADVGGLRVLDLASPDLHELGFVAVPGGALTVTAQGKRAMVGCNSRGSEIATIDLTRPERPRLTALTRTSPAERDLLANGLTHLTLAGGTALSVTELINQDGVPVQSMLAGSALSPDGAPHAFVHANLPSQSQVAEAKGGAVAVLQGPVIGSPGAALGAFVLPQLSVTQMTPPDREEQVAVQAPELAIELELSIPADPASLTQSSMVLRAQDAVIGPVVPATVTAAGRKIVIAPTSALSLATTYFLTLTTDVRSVTNLPLAQTFSTRFTTRTANATEP